MQEWVVLYGAPVATIERVRADEIDGAGDEPPGAMAVPARKRAPGAVAARESAASSHTPPWSRPNRVARPPRWRR